MASANENGMAAASAKELISQYGVSVAAVERQWRIMAKRKAKIILKEN
jgi:hypothetical protein